MVGWSKFVQIRLFGGQLPPGDCEPLTKVRGCSTYGDLGITTGLGDRPNAAQEPVQMALVIASRGHRHSCRRFDALRL